MPIFVRLFLYGSKAPDVCKAYWLMHVAETSLTKRDRVTHIILNAKRKTGLALEYMQNHAARIVTNASMCSSIPYILQSRCRTGSAERRDRYAMLHICGGNNESVHCLPWIRFVVLQETQSKWTPGDRIPD